MKRKLITVALLVGVLSLLAVPAFAQDGPTVETLADDLNVVWVALAAGLVFLMQLGFAMVESGLTRAKNAANIVMKNMTDMTVGAVFYWAFGAAIAYSAGTFMGHSGWFDPASNLNISGAGDNGATQFIFQMVFAATAATIISGAVAERMKFSGYVIISMAMTAFIYPVATHWQWPLTDGVGAWLFERGYHDFAGSSLVHMVGGVAALVAASILGPRIGKYDKDGKPRAIPGHNIPFAIFGVFILWFGWFGFNGGSTLAASGQETSIGIILLSTNIAAGAGGVVAMFTTWIKDGKPDVGMTGNGVLAGLVGITAGTNFATGPEAAAIGAICGLVVVFAVLFFDKVRIDDPVGAISVHGVCGAIGTLAVGVIAAGESNGGHTISLGTQALGVVSIAAWTAAATAIVVFLIKVTIGIRVSEKEELEGLDVHEHGYGAYSPDVMAGASGVGAGAYGFSAIAPAVAPTAHPAGE